MSFLTILSLIYMQDRFRICLQICETNSKFLFSKMNQINAKSHPEIGRVNNPLGRACKFNCTDRGKVETLAVLIQFS